jgi:hypothetical protein
MRIVVIAALLALAACTPAAPTSGAPKTAAASAAVSPQASPQASSQANPHAGSSAAPAASGFDPRQAIVGRWGDNGDCAHPLTIKADGSFTASGHAGHWRLEANHLTLSGAGGRIAGDLAWPDRDHMNVIHRNGAVGHSQRCP